MTEQQESAGYERRPEQMAVQPIVYEQIGLTQASWPTTPLPLPPPSQAGVGVDHQRNRRRSVAEELTDHLRRYT